MADLSSDSQVTNATRDSNYNATVLDIERAILPVYEENALPFFFTTVDNIVDFGNKVRVISIPSSDIASKGERIETPITAITETFREISVSKYAYAESFSAEALSDYTPILYNTFGQRVLGAFAHNVSETAVTNILAGVPASQSFYPLNASGTELTSANIVSGSTVTYAGLSNLAARIKASQYGYTRSLNIFFSIEQASQLRKDMIDNFKQVLTPDEVFRGQLLAAGSTDRGYIGSPFLGMNLFESDVVNTATENSVSVSKAIIIGERSGASYRYPVGFIRKWNPTIREGNPSYPLTEGTVLAFVVRYGIGVLDTKGVFSYTTSNALN